MVVVTIKQKLQAARFRDIFFYHVTIILANGNNGIPWLQPQPIELENCLE